MSKAVKEVIEVPEDEKIDPFKLYAYKRMAEEWEPAEEVLKLDS